MNRLLLLMIVLCSDVIGMSRLVSQSTRKKVAPRTTQLALNAPRTFFRTHFIVGYPEPAPYRMLPSQNIFVDEKPPIINGSSAHLLDQDRLTQSFFTTKHDISSIVLTLLSQAQQKISIAAFSLTDTRIANQLIAAHKKGIDVCVIMDAGNMKHYHSKAQKLIDNGLSIWRYDSSLRTTHAQKMGYEQLMHLKWMIVDDVLLQGSANFTKAAQNGDNIESVMVCRCQRTVEEHLKELQELKKYCVKCTPTVAENKHTPKKQQKE